MGGDILGDRSRTFLIYTSPFLRSFWTQGGRPPCVIGWTLQLGQVFVEVSPLWEDGNPSCLSVAWLNLITC